MGHGARRRHPGDLIGNGAGRTGAAPDEGGPCPGHGAGDALGAAGTELQHRPALRRPADAVGLGGNQALVVKLQQHIGFQQLGLDGRSADRDDRLAREDRRSLRHRPDVPVKAEVLQIVEEALVKHAAAPQIREILLRKVEVSDIIHDLFQPSGDGEAAAVRDAAEKHVKVRDLVGHVRLPVAVSHGELVIVAEHGQVDSVCSFHPALLLGR